MDEANKPKEPSMVDIQPFTFSPGQRKILLSLARQAVTSYLEAGEMVITPPTDAFLLLKAGAFVTLWRRPPTASHPIESQLHTQLELRGCIGHIEGDRHLYRVVSEMAVQAATRDFRFPEVRLSEMEEIVIEISILSPVQEVESLDQIEIGVHGLVIVVDSRRGLLLPSVPERYGWSPVEFAENLCRKVGLPLDAWSKRGALFRFTTECFSEADED